jgi:hypothetical protein
MHVRQVLQDCEHALADFSAGATTSYQRSRWVALDTLLRAVGHVLEKVDRPVADFQTQDRIEDACPQLNASRTEPRIFWDFIESERNNLLKMYAVRAAVNISITPGTGTLSFLPVVSGPAASWMVATPTTMDFVMRDGPYKDRDPLDLAREALAFGAAIATQSSSHEPNETSS